MLIPNRIRAAAGAGRTAFGIYVTQPAPALVEVAAAAGLDFVRIDAYHGALSSETIAALIRAAYAAGVCPTVRVANDELAILSALEHGAMAITVPGIDSPEAARAAVRASRYPPRGHRDISRPLRYIGEAAADYFRWADEELIVSAQLESREALERLDEIMAVDGLDMVQTGRNDLSLSLGVPGQPNHPRVLEAEAAVVAAARRHGKMVSLHVHAGPGSVERTRGWVADRIECVTLGSDAQIFYRALQTQLGEATGGAPGSA